MNKLETFIYKLKEDIVFPHQKINLNMGHYGKKLKYNDYLGLVYKDSSNKIKEIGVLARVVGIVNQIAYSSQNRLSTSYSYITVDILGRMKILEYKKIDKTTTDTDLFVGDIELLEDEISIYFFYYLVTTEIKDKISKENIFDKLRSEVSKYFIQKNVNIEFKYEYNYVKYVFLICPYLRLTGGYKQKLIEVNDLSVRMNEILKYLVLLGQQKESDSNKVFKAILSSSSLEENNEKEKLIAKLKNDLMKNYTQQNSNPNSKNKKDIIEDLKLKINSIKMTEEAKSIALDELEKIKGSGRQQNPEHEWILNYLNTLVKLPWDITTKDNQEMRKTKEILERDHFGLQKVKQRIIEYISVRKLNLNNKKGSILCLNGPPGVGKTSLAKSIAEALGKNFYRLSLGGVRDESEIRGHRRTYIASMPGMIINSLIRVQSKNPVILLDEIDKVGIHTKGDVSSSLLEVLDPEQNATFKDNYINTPFDLSGVFFICTSNYLENVSPPLRDRLEVIEIPGYTVQEKIQICKKYLIPKQIKECGLQSENVQIEIILSDEVIESLIVHFTFESGVRQLERNVASICRYVAKDVVEEMELMNIKNNENLEKSDLPEKSKNTNTNFFTKCIIIDENILKEVLGRKLFDIDLDLRTSNPGVAIGLAYTLNGGAITLIETTKFKGKGEILITGNMGDIMKESVSTGLSWIKSNMEFLGLESFDFFKNNLHIHVPQAAVPKDGPSAGITMTISIISLLKSILTRKDTAMTGEISLQGFVLPVGGIKEKCLAAVRNKIRRLILPYQNKYDVDELPIETRNSLEIIFVRNIREVIQHAFYLDIIEDLKLEISPSPKF